MTVDEYIAATPPLRQERLRDIRAIVHRVAPDIVESIEWKMPVYRRGEVYFATASQKSYLSLYIGKAQVDALAAAVPGLKSGKGCLNITDSMPLPPEPLLEAAIRQRLFGRRRTADRVSRRRRGTRPRAARRAPRRGPAPPP